VKTPGPSRPQRFWAALAAVAAVTLAVAFLFVGPPPPERLRLATGSPEGMYHAFGQRYRELLAESDVELELVPTSGSVDNLRRLAAGEVDLAFVQGGTASAVESDGLVGLGSLFYEPLWVFQRGGEGVELLRELAGRRVAVGPKGSGTRVLSRRLLADNGLGEEDVAQLPLTGSVAAEALLAGEVDAVFLVSSSGAAVVRRLLAAPEAELLSFHRARAYRSRHRYLATLVLGRGMIDLEADLPPADRVLLAPVANLAARQDLHPALVPLLVQTARQVHRDGSLFAEPGEFPSSRYADLPIDESTRRILDDGPSFLYRWLPFWLASGIDRMKILLLPLLTLLFPLFKAAPPVYRWRIRSKIYRWYRVLREVDQELDREPDAEAVAALVERLRLVQVEVADVDVPLSYMEEFYNLRMHIDRAVKALATRTG